MIATSHVIVGGAVGVITQNPAAALAAGIISHLICDSIPHFDSPLSPKFHHGKIDEIVWTPGFLTFAIIDSLVAFFVTLYLWDRYFDLYFFSPFAWGALGGYLPDFVDNVPLWSKQVRKLPGFKQFHALHINIHKRWMSHYPMLHYWPLGIATQIVFVFPCLWFIFK